jgi:streptogramin lyase
VTVPVSTDSDFVSPNSLEFAPDGRLYVVDYEAFGGRGGVLLLDPATGAATPLAGGPPFTQPDGLALSPDGSLYVTDLGANSIFRVNPAAGAVNTLSSGPQLADVDGIAVEPSTGRIFATTLSHAVYSVDPQTGVASVLSTGPASEPFSGVGPLTRLPDGTLYVDDAGRIDRIDPATGVATKVADIPDYGSYDMTYDADGNLIIAGAASHAAVKVNPRTGQETVLAPPADSSSYIEGVLVEPPRCNGRVPTIVGTNDPETINASPFADVIVGLGGNDVINGLGGNDLVCGGAGNDTVRGGAGRDTLKGEAGRDTLKGGNGKDVLKGGAGKDRLSGGKGKDRCAGDLSRQRACE